MYNESNQKPVYDLEERTFIFAKKTRVILRKIPRNSLNEDDIKQLIRASGSVGANYIEANESLSKKDFHYRVKVCRKEAKECSFWIRLLMEFPNGKEIADELNNLNIESIELKKIFSSLCEKSK
jgi:four helix bundle protein